MPPPTLAFTSVSVCGPVLHCRSKLKFTSDGPDGTFRDLSNANYVIRALGTAFGVSPLMSRPAGPPVYVAKSKPPLPTLPDDDATSPKETKSTSKEVSAASKTDSLEDRPGSATISFDPSPSSMPSGYMIYKPVNASASARSKLKCPMFKRPRKRA
jgi:hypothetical protein